MTRSSLVYFVRISWTYNCHITPLLLHILDLHLNDSHINDIYEKQNKPYTGHIHITYMFGDLCPFNRDIWKTFSVHNLLHEGVKVWHTCGKHVGPYIWCCLSSWISHSLVIHGFSSLAKHTKLWRMESMSGVPVCPLCVIVWQLPVYVSKWPSNLARFPETVKTLPWIQSAVFLFW